MVVFSPCALLLYSSPLQTVNNTVALLDGLDDWDPQVLENSDE